MKKTICLLIIVNFCFCKNKTENIVKTETIKISSFNVLNKNGETIEKRFNPPDGFERIKINKNSFAKYLRKLSLKKTGEKVYLFNKKEKWNQNAHAAVIDIDTGKRDLQQCADATMRLRAEYLFAQKKYEDIHFNFTNGFNAEYVKWRNGNRISVKGNNVKWITTISESISYGSFRKYMDMVFAYAGTSSLSKEMKKVDIEKMKIGDVFIQGGFPGHAVIVVDMAENKTTNKKLFMLAQSYMPAQDMHVLKNLNNGVISPWYELGFGEILNTPEWRFTKNDLKRF